MGDPDDDNSIEQVINTVESFENTKEEDLLSVIQGFNDAQSSRYEQYRRSHFDRTCIKRIMTATAHSTCQDTSRMQPISQTMTVVMSGAAKMFVGQLTLAALKIMKERNEQGPIRPRHLREAFRRFQRTKAARSVYKSDRTRLF